MSNYVIHSLHMQNIKISSKVDEDVWNDLKSLAQESHQNVSGLLTEAIREYVQRNSGDSILIKFSRGFLDFSAAWSESSFYS